MAHDVTINSPSLKLGNSPAEFVVGHHSAVIGKLYISKGSVVWVPKKATYGYKITWRRLAELMEEHGKHEKS